MKRIELSKGKIFLVICISILILFIGNKIYTNKIIKSTEKQISGVIQPVIERIKLTATEEMDNGEKINRKYKVKFKSVELSSYQNENIKNILSGLANVEYSIFDEEENEWGNGGLTIPVRREGKKANFNIEWTEITSIGARDFFLIDIIKDFEKKEYRNYEELMKQLISISPQDEEKYSECSGSGSNNIDEISFDENGNIIKGDKLQYMMVWTSELVSMKLECEYNLKEFTGEASGDGVIINIKKKAQSKEPLWFAEINDIEKIDFWRDKEDGTEQELIEISDGDKIEKVYKLLTSFEYEYILNEQYNELTNDIKEDMNLTFRFKKGPYFHVIINEKGVFVSNQQVIISSEKSREILEKLMEIAQE